MFLAQDQGKASWVSVGSIGLLRGLIGESESERSGADEVTLSESSPNVLPSVASKVVLSVEIPIPGSVELVKYVSVKLLTFESEVLLVGISVVYKLLVVSSLDEVATVVDVDMNFTFFDLSLLTPEQRKLELIRSCSNNILFARR